LLAVVAVVRLWAVAAVLADIATPMRQKHQVVAVRQKRR